MFVIKVRDGELLDTIERAARERGITNAAIVTLIGAVDSCTLSTMPAVDATKDFITDVSLGQGWAASPVIRTWRPLSCNDYSTSWILRASDLRRCSTCGKRG
jgi:Plants and Prokaryotes Conserved (PCC) domain